MAKCDFEGRVFRTVSNADKGEVSGDTVFHYHQKGDVVWATYQGGEIVFGTLVARMLADGRLDMRYHHINHSGGVMTGECISTPELLPDGRYRMHEEWRWTCGDRSQGRSVIEEVAGARGNK
ncbi:MAG: n-acetylglutamate synthase [Acidobacteriales bacterium]|nr:n-acetylglutamate synthase [Terriglobales bacterium]